MRFSWAGTTYRIRFEYGVWKKRRKTRRAVVCYIEKNFANSKWIAEARGVTHCSEQDVFVRETGRKIALTRTLAGAVRDFRAVAWKTYRERPRPKSNPATDKVARSRALDALKVADKKAELL